MTLMTHKDDFSLIVADIFFSKMERNKQTLNLPVCCESCKSQNKSGDEFRKLISLTSSGLSVYINTTATVGKMDTNRKESVILHNVGNKVLKKSVFFGELSHRKTKCFLCNTLIQRVCNLINEVTEIQENETIAICEHCKRSTAPNKCKKCDDMLKKFLNNQINQYQYRQQALKIRLYEVRRILSLIVDKKNICDHKICQAYYDSNAELKILLELIKSPLPSKRPDIEEYFSLMEQRKDSERENIGQDLFLKYSGILCETKESLVASTSESRSESFCICKYLRNRNVDSTQSLSFPPPTLEPLSKIDSPSKPQVKSTTNVLKDLNERSSAEKKSTFDKTSKKKEEKKYLLRNSSGKKKDNTEYNKENIPLEKQKVKTEGKKKNSTQNADYKTMLKLLKDKNKQKKRTEEHAKKDKLSAIPKIEDLPQIKQVEKKLEIEPEKSESIIECGQKEPLNPPETIYGNRIVPFHELHKIDSGRNEPLIYKIKHEFILPEKSLTETITTESEKTTTTTTLRTKSHPSDATTLPGIIKYELSNKKFIEKGWTQLPYTKIVRRINIYKMVPAYPQFDWFVNHKNQTLYYKSGEKLAEVDDNGCGRWFYKNGRVALQYYKSKDDNAGLKYVVYDIDDVTEGKKNKSRKILASFDHMGNGIVYDDIGNARLKYNQSEGLVIDKKLGPPGKWKWHTLNDPPVLQHVYIDTVEESDKCFKDVIKQHINDPDLTKRPVSEHMLAIEFENFVKEKASKMLQTYKPFEIRIKAVKINEYFSVRIMNQANIQLLFRCIQVSLKVNMGMLLISNEIVDNTVSDVADVATPFDRPISRSKSVNSI